MLFQRLVQSSGARGIGLLCELCSLQRSSAATLVSFFFCHTDLLIGPTIIPVAASATFTLEPSQFSVKAACSVALRCVRKEMGVCELSSLGPCHSGKVCQTISTESCHISRLFSVSLPAKVPYFYWQTDTFIFKVAGPAFYVYGGKKIKAQRNTVGCV